LTTTVRAMGAVRWTSRDKGCSSAQLTLTSI
jgi:hypothetical protein